MELRVKKGLMTQKITRIIPVILFFTAINSYCQEIKQTDITDIAEELAADETDPEAVSTFIERLHELAENPVRLNTGDETEISRLFFLSDFQIKSIAGHIKSTGNILSIYEIASIPGLDRRTAEIMKPFIILENTYTLINSNNKIKNRILINLAIKPGEHENSYLGSHCKALVRYKIDAGQFSAGFTAEKDPGEKIVSGTPPVPDFLSGYVSFTGNRLVRKVIAGDYSAKFGQGTTINTGIHTGLPLTATGYFPSRNDIKPYTSADENNFFRGIATEMAIRKTTITMFFSHNRIDATLVSSGDSTLNSINSIYKSGLHNTASLIQKKDNVSETFYGLNLTMNLKSVTLGINWSESMFSLPFTINITDPADLYDFNGNKRNMLSVYYTSCIGRSLLFGEFSTDYNTRYAMVQGFTLRASGRLTINCLYRNYSPGFGGLHSRGPGNSSSGGNEEGILGNFTFETARHLFISGGYDFCRYPWLKYRTNFPSTANKYEVKIKYIPADNLNIELSYNNRISVTDERRYRGIAGVQTSSAGILKTIVRYSVNDKLSLNCRIDHKYVRQSGSKGLLMSQDLTYRFTTIPITLWVRYCIFNTDNWDSRLYIYENDLLYSFSIPSFAGKGSRKYIMAKWELGNFGELRIKYALTSLIQKYDIPEDRDEVRFQFRIFF